ncbi:subtilisin-like serine-protease S isoform X2 [Rosa chinensis]|uniref:subtilisin-like serine-protease S isoform X2 n=1 Tax=Rosa chinensis TaxID=74649 RepID=UPI000D0900D2|nr:subtilisin-like serine-protease S isoform X2 [Rosa chinensis]
MASFCSAWRRSSILFMLLCVLVAQISTCFSSKVYVVYMGSKNGEDPDEILAQNHQILASVHTGSIEEAQASHIHSYRHGFKGFAARLTDQQAFQISKMPGVVSVFPNSKRSLHTTHSWDFMGLLGEQTLEVSGFNIKNQVNVIVGFIDTGIWPESPSFNDDNMPPVPARWKGVCQSGEAFNASTCNRKVIGARYYKSGYEAEEDSADTVAFSSPRDSAGHGSHTASIAAGRYVSNMTYKGLASGGARGGAPMARIAVYKTCWDTGCYDVDLLAAFDDAIRDGVHILSLSLGPDAPQGDYFTDAISVGSFHAVRHGILVVASAGNEGNPGSVTNLAPWMITVAASSTDRDFTSDIVLGNGVNVTGESLSVFGMKASASIISASEAFAGYFTPYQSSYCLESSLNKTKARGKVLVCRHAESSTESKLAKSVVVKEAGGVGMVLIDEADMDVAVPFVIPSAIIRRRIGKHLLSYINRTRQPMSIILPAKTTLGLKPAPHVTAFSAKGPNALTPEILKPDITAPGLNILASWSPAVAATLLDKKHKPIAVDPEGKNGNAFDYGSGFLNPTRALDPGLIFDAQPADYVSFLCSVGYDEKSLHQITLDNSTCAQSFRTASDLNYPSITVPNLEGNISVTRTVTNVGKPKNIYKAAVSSPKGINVTVIPNQLVFTSLGQKLNFTVNFKVVAPSKGYKFGFLSWMSGRSRVTSPLVVQVAHSNSGLMR